MDTYPVNKHPSFGENKSVWAAVTRPLWQYGPPVSLI